MKVFTQTTIFSVMITGACLSFGPTALAQHVETPTERLVTMDKCDVQANDTFGRSVAGGMFASLMVVGSKEDDADNGGYACTFRVGIGTYDSEEMLRPSDPVRDGRFGEAVAVSTDGRIIVGAPGADGGSILNTGPFPAGFAHGTAYADAGAAYVFRHNGVRWVEEAKLLASDGGIGDHIGSSVAIYGDLALVGASSLGAGKVYVYQFIEGDWYEVQILRAPDVESVRVAGFGHAVSLDKKRALIGAPTSSVHGEGQAGTAHFYEFDSSAGRFDLEFDLINESNFADFDELGFSVDINDDYAVVGAPNGNNYGALNPHFGYVQILRHNGSTWQLTTPTNDGLWTVASQQQWSQFGYSVAIATRPHSPHVMVGAPFFDNNGNDDEGQVVIFTEDSSGQWIQSGQLLASSPDEDQRFGYSIDLPESFFSFAMVGTPTTAASGETGSVAVFELH